MPLPSWLKNAIVAGSGDETPPVEEQTAQPQRKVVPPVTPKKITIKPVIISTGDKMINSGAYVAERTDDDGEVGLDESYINHLSEFMEKNNQPGPDYLEFARSLDEMNTEMGDGVTEEKIFQMTYKVGYKQNLPVPKLLETANTYINLFNQHKKEFDGYLDQESQKTVGSRAEENNQLTKANTDAAKKIEELTKQIASLESSVESNNTKIEENNGIIETETNKLTVKKAKFEKAFQFVVGKITDDITKIKQYLSNIK